jgi:hypothetical protein
VKIARRRSVTPTALEDRFHLVVVILIEPTNLLRFFRTLQLAAHVAILPTVAGFRCGLLPGLAARTKKIRPKRAQMHISKEGDPYLRPLLVQGAQHILGPFGPDCDLRRWA